MRKNLRVAFIFALVPSDLIVPPVVAAIPTTPVPSILTSPVLVTVELLAASSY